MDNASARNMWGDYLDQHLEDVFHEAPRTKHFCDNAEDAKACLKLILSGTKKATSHSLLVMQLKNDILPKIGDFTVITDWDGKAKCIIKTTKVEFKPFFSITGDYAALEGDGDKSLDHWKEVHWDYYTRELEPYGREPRESMIVVFETFEKVFQR